MNIVRIYNQNRKKIWKAIFIIASFIIVLQYINYRVGKSNQEELENISKTNSSSTNNSGYVSNTSTYTGKSKATTNMAGVSGGTVSSDTLSNTQNLLDEFFGYCNSKNLESAYNMLTDECKELVYPSLDLFTANYYNNIFNNETRIYSFKNWNQNTYIVTIEEDVLATGKSLGDSGKMTDYVTIVDEKLNISSFVKREEINKTTTSNGITVIVNYRDVFMEYESYNLTVTNNTGKKICLANVDDVDGVYLQDDNDLKYDFYNYELMQSDLILENNYNVELNLKFYSTYVSTKEIEKIVFAEVMTDYDGDQSATRALSAEV